jgi:hypothetical protein
MKRVGVVLASLGLLAGTVAVASPVNAIPYTLDDTQSAYRSCDKSLYRWLDSVEWYLERAAPYARDPNAIFAMDIIERELRGARNNMKLALKYAKNPETRSLIKAYIRTGKYGVLYSDFNEYESLYFDIMDNVDRGRC